MWPMTSGRMTTYRLMAVAVGKADLLGSGEAHVTTSKPLMVRPVLPRVIRAGDRFDVSALVTNATASPPGHHREP